MFDMRFDMRYTWVLIFGVLIYLDLKNPAFPLTSKCSYLMFFGAFLCWFLFRKKESEEESFQSEEESYFGEKFWERLFGLLSEERIKQREEETAALVAARSDVNVPAHGIEFSTQQWTVTKIFCKRPRPSWSLSTSRKYHKNKQINYVTYILNIEIHDTNTNQLLHTFQTTERRYSSIYAFKDTFSSSIDFTTTATFPPKTLLLWFNVAANQGQRGVLKERQEQLLLWFNEMLDKDIIKGGSLSSKFVALKVATWLLDATITPWMFTNMAPPSHPLPLSLPLHVPMAANGVPIEQAEVYEATRYNKDEQRPVVVVPSAPPLMSNESGRSTWLDKKRM